MGAATEGLDSIERRFPSVIYYHPRVGQQLQRPDDPTCTRNNIEVIIMDAGYESHVTRKLRISLVKIRVVEAIKFPRQRPMTADTHPESTCQLTFHA